MFVSLLRHLHTPLSVMSFIASVHQYFHPSTLIHAPLPACHPWFSSCPSFFSGVTHLLTGLVYPIHPFMSLSLSVYISIYCYYHSVYPSFMFLTISPFLIYLYVPAVTLATHPYVCVCMSVCFSVSNLINRVQGDFLEMPFGVLTFY